MRVLVYVPAPVLIVAGLRAGAHGRLAPAGAGYDGGSQRSTIPRAERVRSTAQARDETRSGGRLWRGAGAGALRTRLLQR